MSIDGKVTNEKHFTFGNTTSLDLVSPSIIEEKSTTMRNDGNNIDVEKEKVEQTKNNTGLKLCFAFIYGGRDEIVWASKKLAKNSSSNGIGV